jgi:putative membrane protein
VSSVAERRPAILSRLPAQAWFERTVTAHRVTIAVVFPAVGAVLLLASAVGLLPGWLAFNGLLLLVGVVVMRSPLLVAVAPLVTRRAGLVLLGVTAFTYGIEAVGIATGWPYGAFTYLADLGPMVAGVPVALPLLFLPLVVNAVLLSVLVTGGAGCRRIVRVPVAIAVLLVVDLVLDPAAVALGFWAFDGSGVYFGVPLSNYAGWLFSGTIAVLAIDLAFPREALLARLRACPFALDDFVSFTLLWGAINVAYGHWLPAVLAGGLLVALATTPRFDLPGLGRAPLSSITQ